MQTNAAQLIAFLETFYAGVLIGLCYDIIQYALYAVFRKRLFSDVLFWTVTAAVALTSMFRATELNLRLYLICGILVGWALYFLTISPIFRLMFDKVQSKTSAKIRKTKDKAKTKINRFIINNKQTIGKINLTFKRLSAIPMSLKKVYNKYTKYFRETKNHETKPRKEKKENKAGDAV